MGVANGRMYDPGLALFLSPDPYIQAPDNWLNYNRYSYCLNNAFLYMDPSGEFWELILASAIFSGIGNGIQTHHSGSSFWEGFAIGTTTGLVSGLAGYAVANAVFNAMPISGFWGSFVSNSAGSFVSGAFSGGNLRSGVSAGIFSEVMEGLSSGLAAWEAGYSFWDGSQIIHNEIPPINIENGIKYDPKQLEYDTDLLHIRFEDTWNVKEGNYNITKLTTDPGKGYVLTTQGNYMRSDGEFYSAGYMKSWKDKPNVEVHIAPRYVNNPATDHFKAITGHELTHVLHKYYIPSYNKILSEPVAYKHTINTYLKYDKYINAFKALNNAVNNGYYPSIIAPEYQRVYNNFFRGK